MEQKILKTHPKHLFHVIQDVDSYSEFLPLCSYSKILKTYDNGMSFDATLTVGLPFGPGLQESYVSRVQLNPRDLIIETKSIESKLFDSLKSRWKLATVSPKDNDNDTTTSTLFCDVDFEVEMTVSDPVIAQVLDKVLKEVAERQVAAFAQRCKQIPPPADLISSEPKQ